MISLSLSLYIYIYLDIHTHMYIHISVASSRFYTAAPKGGIRKGGIQPNITFKSHFRVTQK